MSHPTRIFTVLALVAAAFSAGCSTPLAAAKLDAQVLTSQRHDRYHGAPIRVIYRARPADAPSCDEACLRAADWSSFSDCSGTRDPETMRITIGQSAHRFAACTAPVPVDQVVDVAAFIDLNDDGSLGADEPFGVARMRAGQLPDSVIIGQTEPASSFDVAAKSTATRW